MHMCMLSYIAYHILFDFILSYIIYSLISCDAFTGMYAHVYVVYVNMYIVYAHTHLYWYVCKCVCCVLYTHTHTYTGMCAPVYVLWVHVDISKKWLATKLATVGVVSALVAGAAITSVGYK